MFTDCDNMKNLVSDDKTRQDFFRKEVFVYMMTSFEHVHNKMKNKILKYIDDVHRKQNI